MGKFTFQLIVNLSKVCTWVENWRLREHRALAQQELDAFIAARPLEGIPAELSNRGFEWRRDPAGGMLDFVSEPWATWYKKTFDCDDAARLWLYCAQKKGVTTGYPGPCCVSAVRLKWFQKPGGHAVFIAPCSRGFTVFSNLNIFAPLEFPTIESIANRFVAGWTNIFFYDQNLKIARVIDSQANSRTTPADLAM